MSSDFQPGTSLPDAGGAIGESEPVVMTVTEERLDVRKQVVESGGALRLRKIVHEEVVAVDEPLTIEVAEVERIAIDRPVDTPPEIRYEGDVMVVPVVAERLVTRTQLVLVEELRVTRRMHPKSAPQQVTLRREEVVVERLDPASGEWRMVDAAEAAPATSREPAGA